MISHSDLRLFFAGWIGTGALLLVIVASCRQPARGTAAVDAGRTGCQASCPTAPRGCERAFVDPGSCEAGCAGDPVCHYRSTLESDAQCPEQLVGRCITP